MLRASVAVFALALLSTVALAGCDDMGDDHDDHDDHSHGDTGGETLCDSSQSDRAATILNLAVDTAAGEDVFDASCGNVGCHGADGSSGPAPDLGDHVSGHTDEGLACLLLAGTGNMPAQAFLADQELADVMAYVMANF